MLICDPWFHAVLSYKNAMQPAVVDKHKYIYNVFVRSIIASFRVFQRYLTILFGFVCFPSLFRYTRSTQKQLLWAFFLYYLFFACEKLSLFRYVEAELSIKLRHLNSMGNILDAQLFLIHYSRRSSWFYSLRWCAQSMIFFKRNI